MSFSTPDSASNDSGLHSLPPAVVRFLQILGWDGALPLLTALGPAAIKSIWPQPPGPAVVFLIFAPPVAAFIRTHIGWHQIAKRCGGHAPWLRQVAMAAAIVLLLGFEIVVSILTFDNAHPASDWLIPVGFYAGYLVMVSFALRPSRDSARFSGES